MEKTISTTEAKTHFGMLMKRATEKGETFIVERSGIPQIAIVPIGEFERMKARRGPKGREITLHRIRTFRQRICTLAEFVGLQSILG